MTTTNTSTSPLVPPSSIISKTNGYLRPLLELYTESKSLKYEDLISAFENASKTTPEVKTLHQNLLSQYQSQALKAIEAQLTKEDFELNPVGDEEGDEEIYIEKCIKKAVDVVLEIGWKVDDALVLKLVTDLLTKKARQFYHQQRKDDSMVVDDKLESIEEDEEQEEGEIDDDAAGVVDGQCATEGEGASAEKNSGEVEDGEVYEEEEEEEEEGEIMDEDDTGKESSVKVDTGGDNDKAEEEKEKQGGSKTVVKISKKTNAGAKKIVPVKRKGGLDSKIKSALQANKKMAAKTAAAGRQTQANTSNTTAATSVKKRIAKIAKIGGGAGRGRGGRGSRSRSRGKS